MKLIDRLFNAAYEGEVKTFDAVLENILKEYEKRLEDYNQAHLSSNAGVITSVLVLREVFETEINDL